MLDSFFPFTFVIVFKRSWHWNLLESIHSSAEGEVDSGDARWPDLMVRWRFRLIILWWLKEEESFSSAMCYIHPSSSSSFDWWRSPRKKGEEEIQGKVIKTKPQKCNDKIKPLHAQNCTKNKGNNPILKIQSSREYIFFVVLSWEWGEDEGISKFYFKKQI